MSDTIALELIPIDNPAKLPPGKLRPLSDGELPPAEGRIYIYRAPTPVGGHTWTIALWEAPEERTQE